MCDIYTVETPSLEIHIINEASIIERSSIFVHPVANITYAKKPTPVST